MIDRNNLNRIKGILSARAGAEIPKFDPGGSIPQYNHNDPDFVNFINLTKARHNPITWERYQKLKQLNPSASIDQLAADYNSGKDVQANSGIIETPNTTSTTALEIPGDPKLTPTTVIENATKRIANLEEVKEKVEINDIVASQELPEVVITAKKLNTPPLNQDTKDNQEEEEENDSEKKPFISEKTAGKIGEYATKGLQMAGEYFGAKQAATDSSLTKGADALYDTAAETVKKFGPVGQVVGTAMGFAGTAGDIIQGLGGGTDQMTTTDKWMDSSFFSWNIGMLNGFGGKRSDAFAADKDILASVGSSYGGTTEDINNAAAKANKKYGLFSSGARRKANRQIAAARAKQNLMGDISEEATDQRLAAQSMGEQAGLAYTLMTDGGYSQKYTYAAKQGGILEWIPEIELDLEWHPQIDLNWELPEFKEGGSFDIQEELEWIPNFQDNKSDFNTWFNSIPKQYRATGYDYKKAYEVFDWDLLSKHAKDPNKYHLYSVSPIPDANGNYPFLKLGKLNENPELKGEFDWYNSEEGKEHKSKFDIQYIKDRYYYVPKKFKNGGKTEISDIPEIEETTQKNVIPEGALHKNKHHMEHAEGLTKKGIPVIDKDGEQQAEIEHSEIIFTLEVTKKLEEYYDIFYSEDSSNKEKEQAALDAGKLLVYQILENTEDRTGLIESCKKGGSLALKKSTDDLIEEVLEWMPTIVIVEETIKESKEEKSDKSEKKSEKDQIKQAIKEVLIELLTQ